MKRSLALAAVLVVVLSAAAFAGVQEFAKFTINVADGWTAVDNQGTAVITKNDNTAQLTISVADAGGATKAQLAEAFVAEFKKTFAEVGTPVADEDGDYSWEMKTTNGAVSEAYLSADGSDFMLFVVTNRQAAADDISAMLGSIKDK
ncbi:MAG: hypothetical protein IJQ08_03215 [Synergistaceae bacterium]|nr:hypothetical protein [Synergistaceae bacterium]